MIKFRSCLIRARAVVTMPITDEDRSIVASCLKFLEDQIKSGELPEEAVESLAVAVDCVNNVYHVTGAERTVELRDAYRTAIKAMPVWFTNFIVVVTQVCIITFNLVHCKGAKRSHRRREEEGRRAQERGQQFAEGRKAPGSYRRVFKV